MFGAIIGDIVGSVYEFSNTLDYQFEMFAKGSTFTDDTVLTVAVADCILNGKAYGATIKEYARSYPDCGYGGRFYEWMLSDSVAPYNSLGNGSAMRVSPVGFAFDALDRVLQEAARTAEVTHNHPEGIKGAQATAAAIFLARQGETKQEIRAYVEKNFGYNLGYSIAAARQTYAFDATCPGSVPQAIAAFLESEDFESAIRTAVWLGGDSDTIACIAGGIAQAFYGSIPEEMVAKAKALLDPRLLMISDGFEKKFLK